MSTMTQNSAPSPLGTQAGRGTGRIVRIDAPHAELRQANGPLAWTDYVPASLAAASSAAAAPPATAAWSDGAAPEGTAADPSVVSRARSSHTVNPQPVLPVQERDRDVRAGVYRQRFYPEQWRRLAQPAIDRLVTSHGQRLQWVGWDRSLPQLYLPAEHLTRVIVDLLQLALRSGAASAGGASADRASAAGAQPLGLRVGWQSGVTHTLVLVLEHPQLKLPAALMQYASAPLAQSERVLKEPAEAAELVRVRALLRATGGSLAASRTRGGGTQFRLSLPTDDRTTLVRAWLEQAAQSLIPTANAMPQAFLALAEAPRSDALVYQSQIRLFVIGRRNAESLAALNRRDAGLQALAGSGDFVYRAARSRWLWLTMHSELPTLEPADGWQSQLISRWNCLAQAALLTEQQTAAFHGLSRAIVAKMDQVLGRRVPPLDMLAAPPLPRTRQRRFDRAAASPVPSPSQLPTHATSSARVSLGSVPPSMRRPRWRYPI